MDGVFWTKVTISFLLGGAWVGMATILADKLGSKIGGLLLGLPSTIAFSLFFIALTQNPQTAASATTIEPVSEGVCYLYILTYILLAKKNFWIALLVSLAVWLTIALALIKIGFDSYSLSLISYAALLVIAYWLIEHVFKVKSLPGRKINYTLRAIGGRGIISGSVIASAAVLGKIGGPIWGGAFSVFPAAFTSTLLITYLAHGIEFSIATIKSALFGSVSVIVYSVVVRYAYIPLGTWIGTILAMSVSLAIVYLIYRYLVKNLA